MTVSLTKLSASSWFKIKIKNKVIHIDPGYIGYFENQGIPEGELEEKADLIMVTHFHKDHLQPEPLNKIRSPLTTILAPNNCAKRIEGNFKLIKPDDKLDIKDIQIKVVNAYNTPEGNSTRKFHHKGDGIGYLITIDDKTIYHAGDTDFIPEMKDFDDIDLALIPIGGTFTMDREEAINAVLAIKPRFVIPMHMRDADPEAFKKIIEEKSDSKVIPLNIGEIYELK
ncbi:MBL fold metallo-hydrolase [Methanobacterium oryzae]|uniref:MBL fold metallo-hydrolase n=1 Tax=Methanobacterium oryzae TaxID=69540 RepID=UPI003D1B8A92